MVRSQHERNVALTKIWEALHEYREELIPSNCDDETNQCRDEIWDEICFSMAVIKECLDE
jgi:hypothetical protein